MVERIFTNFVSMKKIILILVSINLLISCRSTKTSELPPSFEVLKKSYPILEKYEDSLVNTLSIDYKSYGMRFNVFSTSGDLHLLAIEVNGKTSSIPIMPLNDSCYWRYENYSGNYDTAASNFKSEYERLLEEVGIKDSSIGVISRPYAVIIQHILYFDPATWQDTINFLQPCFFYPSSEDSLRLRNARKTYATQITKLMHPSPNFYINCAHKSYDGHVFWFDFNRRSKRDKWQLIFKSWKFDCPELPSIIL